MKKLAIVTTHPIQYNAPLFRLLHDRANIEIKVFYTWSQSGTGIKYDPGFKQQVAWDIPLLSGYPYVFSDNISAAPGSHHHKGIDNPSLIKEISSWKADAVLVYGWNFKSHLAAMRFFHGKIPVLFRGDSTLLDEQPGFKKILRRIYLRYIFSKADRALYAGKANYAYFLAHGFKESELVFMPHSIDNDRFGSSESVTDGQRLRERMDIPREAMVFLFAGKLEEKKQPLLLAVEFVAVNNSNAYLIIAGSGQEEAVLKVRFATHPNIRFTGFVNQQQMPALYAACDVFVLPSKGPHETWGLSINEAMAAGKAVIVSNACGAAQDLVKEEWNGFVFAKNDGAALRAKLLFYAGDPGAAKEHGLRSAKMIRAYSFEKDCEAIETAVSVVGK